MKHYTKEELENYRQHGMSMLGCLACSAHLKECATCTDLLKQLEADEAFVSELRDSIRIYEEAAKHR
ncbi:MAG: hypothetical protein K5787_02735 [Lentisphaeria bacterium]|nr:hypothetical protein [Lentisphaeria bacterium]